MKVKFKNILMVSFLAIAGIFGMTSILVNKQAEVAPVAEKAEAADGFVGGEIFYIVDKNPKFDDCDCRLNIYGHGHGTLSEIATFAFRFEEASGTNYITYGLKIPAYDFDDGGSWEHFKMLRYKRDYASDTGYVPEHAFNESYECNVSDYKSYSTWWTEAWEGGNFAVGKSNTFTQTTSGDTALLFRLDTNSGYVDSCKVALHYGGYGLSRTVDTEVIGDHLRAATIPAGVTSFQLLRVNNSLSLPVDGYPASGVYHNNQFIYSSSNNMVTIHKYSGSEYSSEYGSSDKTLVPKGTRYIFKNDGVLISDWFVSNAVPFFVSWPASSDYYGGYTQWLMMYRIGQTQYMEVTTDRTLCMADYAYTRNNTYSGWSNVYNQTKDITINRNGGLVCANGEYGGKVNFRDTTDEDYADLWGAVFMSCVTCDGVGNITSSDWSKTRTEYLGLTETQRGIVFTETGVISDSTYRAMGIYRYDYIIHKYGTGTYSDYINRIDGKGDGSKYPYDATRSFSNLSLFGNEEESLSTIIIIAASGVALLSITALSVLAIKKRKNKEE